jgi:hypothetical protein
VGRATWQGTGRVEYNRRDLATLDRKRTEPFELERDVVTGRGWYATSSGVVLRTQRQVSV